MALDICWRGVLITRMNMKSIISLYIPLNQRKRAPTRGKTHNIEFLLFYKGSFIIYEVGGGGIYTKVVANVANHLDKTLVMVHDDDYDECEGKN